MQRSRERNFWVLVAAILIALTPIAGGSAGAVHGGINVAPHAIVTTPTDGTAFTHNVTFTDSNPSPVLGGAIDWGDGTTTLATISGPVSGVYTASGTHTWANEGPETVITTINDTSTSPATVATPSTTYTVSEGDVVVTDATLTPTEGQSMSGGVLMFSDGSGSESADTGASFTATLDWGDGTTSSGTITGAAGGPYTVSGSHTYADEGSATIKATVNETGVPQSPLFVENVPVTIGEGDVISSPTFNLTTATEGTNVGAGTVASFTDSYTGNVASDFTAAIDWGDGTTSAGTITDVAGAITVSSSGHTYADEGNFSASVVLTDDAPGTATSTASGSIAVAEADALTGHAATVAPVEGASFTGTVATFSNTYTGNVASDFVPTIDWGDGTTTSGTVSGGSGTFSVGGTHTYLEEGTQHPKVYLADDAPGTATANTTSTANVADAGLNANGVSFVSPPGVLFSGKVAHFTDNDPNGVVGDYAATIDWGDGTTTAGAIVTGGGGFDVNGTHTYSTVGPNTLTVTVNDAGGSTAVVHPSESGTVAAQTDDLCDFISGSSAPPSTKSHLLTLCHKLQDRVAGGKKHKICSSIASFLDYVNNGSGLPGSLRHAIRDRLVQISTTEGC